MGTDPRPPTPGRRRSRPPAPTGRPRHWRARSRLRWRARGAPLCAPPPAAAGGRRFRRRAQSWPVNSVSPVQMPDIYPMPGASWRRSRCCTNFRNAPRPMRPGERDPLPSCPALAANPRESRHAVRKIGTGSARARERPRSTGNQLAAMGFVRCGIQTRSWGLSRSGGGAWPVRGRSLAGAEVRHVHELGGGQLRGFGTPVIARRGGRAGVAGEQIRFHRA